MRSFNQAVLLGHVAADPEIKASTKGKVLATFPLAIQRDWPQTKDEEAREVDYHKIVAWNKLAEVTEKHIKKGSKILLNGKILNNQYEDKEGKTRTVCEIHANQIQILSWKEAESEKKAPTKKEKVAA